MHKYDFAIITPLAEEWLAVRAHLQDVVDMKEDNPTVTGRIGEYSVVLRMPYQVGGYSAATLSAETVLTWKPRWMVLAGIAGGFPSAGVSAGDVVVASRIYPYEYGKVKDGAFERRDVFDVAPDPAWLARTRLAIADDKARPNWTSLIRITRPDGARKNQSRLHCGPVASGEKVIDDADYEFFVQARAKLPELLAIEMEAAGVATTVEHVRSSRLLGFLMIRGISDTPRSAEDGGGAEQFAGTAQRDGWKKYAAAAAAAYLTFLLTREGGPRPLSDQPWQPSPSDANESDQHPVGEDSDAARDAPQAGNTAIREEGGLDISPDDELSPILGTLPPPVRRFLGRDEVIEQLHTSFVNSDHNPAVVAITGLSGIGKTQLCRQYVDRYRTDYQTIVWISGENEATAMADLGTLVESADVGNVDDTERQRPRLQAAHDWFARNHDWLLVIDNTRPLLVTMIAPANGQGNILASSTYPNWSSVHGCRIALEGLSSEWGTSFLLERTGSTQAEAAQRLCSAFEGLPLALEQAAAYISTSSIDVTEYETLLETHRPKLMSLKSEFTSYPMSVYAALAINVNAAFDRSPIASPLLCMLSYMAPRDFPRDIAFRAMEVLVAQNDDRLSAVDLDQAIASLSSASLLTATPTHLSTHALVQAFVRDSLDQDAQERWLAFCVEVLSRTFPSNAEDSSNWPECEALVDHVIEFWKSASHSVWEDEYAVALFMNAGSYLHLRDRNQQAFEIQAKVLEHMRSVHGSDAAETALACNNLVDIMVDIGRSDEALALGEEGIAILERIPTLTKDESINLGKMYSNVGRMLLYGARRGVAGASLDRSEACFRRALMIHEELLGREHYTTAIDINNLGAFFREQGEWHEARGHFAEAVTVHRLVLSADDYRLAIALYNYGQASFNLNEFWDAEAALRESVRIFEEIGGGADRWDYNESLFGFGLALQRLGRHREAMVWLARSVAVGTDLSSVDSPMVQSAVATYGWVAALAVAPWVQRRVRWAEGGARQSQAYLGRRPVESVYPSRIHLFLETGHWIASKEYGLRREKGLVGQYLERQSRLERDRRLAF